METVPFFPSVAKHCLVNNLFFRESVSADWEVNPREMFVGPPSRNNLPRGALRNRICIFYKNGEGQNAQHFVILRRASSFSRQIAPGFRSDCKANPENRAGNDGKIAGKSLKETISKARLKPRLFEKPNLHILCK